ncbi:hypothetical protein DBV15_06918 [Temnothorax longispinosus]|uniref:Uncharacterized protein n=1 Tax=Temnothorax longispinosus TaxID=300112 RepID=A0A4S2KRX2_9HYME|nr:hypothetical protein DBV15_06918 [Temnothorax longispinosus]
MSTAISLYTERSVSCGSSDGTPQHPPTAETAFTLSHQPTPLLLAASPPPPAPTPSPVSPPPLLLPPPPPSPFTTTATTTTADMPPPPSNNLHHHYHHVRSAPAPERRRAPRFLLYESVGRHEPRVLGLLVFIRS